MKVEREPLRGFRDIVADLADALRYAIDQAVILARDYGFDEIFLPTVERFSLFALKSGEEIARTMFVFKDKAGREVALRPEATASVVRAFLHKMLAFPKPLKLFTIVNVFRYDEPQFARYREFYQADFEILGTKEVLADAELITMLDDYYTRLKIEHEILVGSVRVLRYVLSEEGVNEDLQDHVLHLIDKGFVDRAVEELKGKVKDFERISNFLKEIVKVRGREAIERGAELLKEYYGNEEAIRELMELDEYLPDDVKSKVTYVAGFARGLAYYTGIIYEVKVPGFPVSVAGGGRYDNLVELYGGPSTPATGFAIGLDRTALVLDGLRLKKRGVIVIPLCKECGKMALEITRELASLDIPTFLMDEFKSLKKALSFASSKEFRGAIIIGKRELERGVMVVKNLDTYGQVECEDLECAVNALRE